MSTDNTCAGTPVRSGTPEIDAAVSVFSLKPKLRKTLKPGRTMKYFCAVCIVPMLASALHGNAIYDNTGAATDGADCVDFTTCGTGPDSEQLYDSFTSGGTPEQLVELNLILSGDPTSSGVVQAGLYSDNSTEPGALIADLGSLSDSVLSDQVAEYDVTLAVTPSLAANTRYWIGLSGTTTAEWAWSLDTSGPGVAGEFYENPSGTFPSSDGAYQMSVIVTETPEPASILLIAAGAGLLGLLRRGDAAGGS